MSSFFSSIKPVRSKAALLYLALAAEALFCCAAQATTVQHWQLRDLVHSDGEQGVFFVQSNRTMRYDTKTGIVSLPRLFSRQRTFLSLLADNAYGISCIGGLRKLLVKRLISQPRAYDHMEGAPRLPKIAKVMTRACVSAVRGGATAGLCSHSHDSRLWLPGSWRPEQLCELRPLPCCLLSVHLIQAL